MGERLRSEERGADVIEYVGMLIFAAIIVLAILVAANGLKGSIVSRFRGTSTTSSTSSLASLNPQIVKPRQQAGLHACGLLLRGRGGGDRHAPELSAPRCHQGQRGRR